MIDIRHEILLRRVIIAWQRIGTAKEISTWLKISPRDVMDLLKEAEKRGLIWQSTGVS